MQYIKSANDYQAEPARHSQYIYSEQGMDDPVAVLLHRRVQISEKSWAYV